MANENIEKSSRGYRLMFIPYMGGEDYSYCFLELSSLEIVDNFTSQFDNCEEMVQYITSYNGEKIDVIGAYIERVGGKKKRYEVMYHSDKFDTEKVIKGYQEYFLKHPNDFKKYASARKVRLCEEDYVSLSNYISACCLAYFKDRNYRNVRGAYFELKRNGLDKKVILNQPKEKISLMDSSCYTYYSEDEFLNELLNRYEEPDWETIYKYYSHEDVTRLVKREVSKRRGSR